MNRRFPQWRRYRPAFSLIELLVALSLVAVIAVLSWPLFSKVRREMQKATCSSNLRQMGSVIFAYAADHNGCLPQVAATLNGNNAHNHWRRTILPYIGKSQTGSDVWYTPFTCPPIARQLEKKNIRPGIPSYGMNYRLEHVPLAKIRQPSRTLMATEADISAGVPSEMLSPHQIVKIAPGAHGDGQNILYADGHVAFFSDIARLSAPPFGLGGEQDVWTP